jgi:hypothetical protein
LLNVPTIVFEPAPVMKAPEFAKLPELIVPPLRLTVPAGPIVNDELLWTSPPPSIANVA